MPFYAKIIASCVKSPKRAAFSTILAVAAAVVYIALHRSVPRENQETVDITVDATNDDWSYPNDGKWYNFSNTDFTFLAFSAFYDDRPSLLSDPVIRIVAISDLTEDRTARNIKQLYCILHNDDGKDIFVSMAEDPLPIGDGNPPLNGRTVNEYVYSCPSIRNMIPVSVSIVTSQSEYYPSGVPVTLPVKPDEKREFCVCVQVTYGTVDPYRLIEWLELQRILGVSLIGVSVFATSNETLKVLRHYADEGFVNLRQINHFYPNDEQQEHYNLQATPTINDCMYRHMYECQRIAIMDFDEFIMPRKHANLKALVSYLEQRLRVKDLPQVNFAFRNNYFFLDLPPDEKISPYMTILRFRKKVPVSPVEYSMKSIINPQACTHAHTHYCWGLTAMFSRPGNNEDAYANTEEVEPELALNQHYKKCHFEPSECCEILKNVTRDDIMWRVKRLLTKRFSEKVKIIMNHSISSDV